MAKGDRIGNRKTREQRRTIKVPELGYYLIVTDTEGTERCFFTGLHQSLPVVNVSFPENKFYKIAY